MRPAAAIALALVALAGAPRHGRADASDLSGWLDADAPVVVSLRPTLLTTGATLLADAFGREAPELARAAAAGRAGSIAAFGADLLSRDGWLAAGLDPDQSVLISLGAIDDGRAEHVYDELFALDEWTDAKLRKVRKTYWRSRAVVSITDAKQAARTVRTLAAFASDIYAINKREATEIAMMLGGAARKAESVEQRLRKRKLVAIGWLEGFDAVIALRVLPKRKLLVIDVVGSFAGVPNVWTRDSRKLLAAIERNPGTSKLPAILAQGTGADALGADFAVWLQPAALLEFARASRRHRALRVLATAKPAAARRRELHREASAEIGQCNRLRPLATRGPLLDVAFTLDLDARGLRGRARWGLRKGNKLAPALAVRDDALMTWPGPKDAVITAAHYLGDVRALRALARPRVMRKGFDKLDDAMRQCGGGANFIAALFGWHALAGMALDEVVADDAALAAVVDGAGNGALAIRKVGKTDHDLVGGAAVSVNAAGAKALATALDGALGPRDHKRLRKRRVTLWSSGAARAFRFSPAKDVTAFGAAESSSTGAWLVRAAGPSADHPSARWRVEVPALLEQLPPIPAWLRTIAAHIDSIDGTLTLDDRTLSAKITPHIR